MKSELEKMIKDLKLIDVMRKNNRILNILSDYSGEAKVLTINYKNLNLQKEIKVKQVKKLIEKQDTCLRSLSKLRKLVNI